jgi:tetratricopeptide (TPR) repeat protein
MVQPGLKATWCSADVGSVRFSFVLVCAAVSAGCGGVLSSGDAQPRPAASAPESPPGIRGLRVRVAEKVAIVVDGSADARLDEHLKAALQSELGRWGLTVIHATDKAVDLTVRIETRVTGAVGFLRGHIGLTAEKNGVTMALASTEVELHSDGEFPAVMIEKAVTKLLHSPALAEYAERTAPRHEVKREKPPAAHPPAKIVLSAESQAKSHFNRGTSFYNIGRFADALAEYEAAYLAVQDPPFLFDIAQCHRKMGNSKEALASYRTYLRVAPNAPNRAEVQKRISELEREARVAQ